MKNKEWLQFLGFLSIPPLWKENEILNLKQFAIPEIKHQEPFNIPEELPSLQSNFVLGKRIESFYSLVLNRSDEYKILTQGLQIFQEKVTLGELDFLLARKGGEEIIHLEVVYKFYVYDPALQGELERWVGPNRKDTLLKKLNKLEQKQFPLLYRKETNDALHKLGVAGKPVIQQVSFLAHLFLPRNLSKNHLPLINNDCVAGTWIYKKDFSPEDFGDKEFYIPVKQDWPIDPAFNSTWLSFENITGKVEESVAREKSPLMWMRSETGEFERFFIVWW